MRGRDGVPHGAALCPSPRRLTCCCGGYDILRDRVQRHSGEDSIFFCLFAPKFEGGEGAPLLGRKTLFPGSSTPLLGGPGAMGIFGSKKVVWVPQNEELKEKCEDAESWAAKERSGAALPPRDRTSPHTCLCVPPVPASACRMRPACMLTGRPVRRRHGSFVGWKVQNDGKLLMNAIGKCESCSNLDLSYNGLGDNEAEALGKALKKNYSGNDKPYAGVAGARMYGTIVKV